MTEGFCAACGARLGELQNMKEESQSPCPSCGSKERKVGIHRERIVDPTTHKVVGPA
jgi:putative FmdB family regulatory protein